MDKNPFRISINAEISYGDLESIVSHEIKEATNEELIPVSDLVKLDSLMLENHDCQTYEMKIDVMPLYLPHVVSLIAECSKIEVYLGNILDYDQTYYGEYIDTIEETKLFRFDVHIKSNMNKVSLKFIVKSEKLYIYGIHLTLIKNPNPMAFTTTSIDFNQVQSILSESKAELSDKAKECKDYLVKSIPNFRKPNDIEEKMSQLSMEQQADLKSYIDFKFTEFEGNITKKFEDLEQKQHEKLDKIVLLLQQLTKKTE